VDPVRQHDAVVAADRVLAREPEIDVEILGAFQVDRETAGTPEKLRSVTNGSADSHRVVRAQHVPVGIVADAHLIPSCASWSGRDDISGIVDELLVPVGIRTLRPLAEASHEAAYRARHESVVRVEEHDEFSDGRL
jgi:hypothetical protein